MKIKIAAISYTNTLPFIYGLKHFMDNDLFDLQLAYPSNCSKLLLENKVDLALMPVASLLAMPEANIISEYCIGADGPVETVCIYSEVPITEIDSILLDYQSKSSVMLSKILLKESWKIAPKQIEAEEGFIEKIKGKTAGLVIGDRAFDLNQSYPYVYDLAEIWKELTGLPFVFAAWVANKELPQNFTIALNSALAKGVDNIDAAINDFVKDASDSETMQKYLNRRIDYRLDSQKQKALKLFLDYGKKLE
jgi:chorismate dehydratase